MGPARRPLQENHARVQQPQSSSLNRFQLLRMEGTEDGSNDGDDDEDDISTTCNPMPARSGSDASL